FDAQVVGQRDQGPDRPVLRGPVRGGPQGPGLGALIHGERNREGNHAPSPSGPLRGGGGAAAGGLAVERGRDLQEQRPAPALCPEGGRSRGGSGRACTARTRGLLLNCSSRWSLGRSVVRRTAFAPWPVRALSKSISCPTKPSSSMRETFCEGLTHTV